MVKTGTILSEKSVACRSTFWFPLSKKDSKNSVIRNAYPMAANKRTRWSTSRTLIVRLERCSHRE